MSDSRPSTTSAGEPPASSGGDWAPWDGEGPHCLLCAGPGPAVAEYHLTHGVSAWLCSSHRSDSFTSGDGGHLFVTRLRDAWRAAHRLGRRHQAALRNHLAQNGQPVRVRPLPGSYSWPELRQLAETRFAGGEHPIAVIHDLRARHAGGDAVVPSIRTMRRWFADGRWRTSFRKTHAEGPRYPAGPPIGTLEHIDAVLGILGYPMYRGFARWPRARPGPDS